MTATKPMKRTPGKPGAKRISMNPITAIKPMKDDPGRCGVYVGRRRVAVLLVPQVQALGLEVGAAWEPGLERRVTEAAAFTAARRHALQIVNRRAIGSAQLIDRLIRRGHAAAVARAVAEDLVERKILDDAAFGQAVLATQLARKPAGRRLLELKLRQKKLPADLARRLSGEAVAGRDAVADARELAEKKLRAVSFRKLDPVARRRRIWGLLARRGFDPQTINDAMEGLAGLD